MTIWNASASESRTSAHALRRCPIQLDLHPSPPIAALFGSRQLSLYYSSPSYQHPEKIRIKCTQSSLQEGATWLQGTEDYFPDLIWFERILSGTVVCPVGKRPETPTNLAATHNVADTQRRHQLLHVEIRPRAVATNRLLPQRRVLRQKMRVALLKHFPEFCATRALKSFVPTSRTTR